MLAHNFCSNSVQSYIKLIILPNINQEKLLLSHTINSFLRKIDNFAVVKVIHISHLPLLKNFYAINLFGVVFSRTKLSDTERRHEYIHTLQQREMLFIFFYIWYVMEWLIRLLQYRNFRVAYINILFEREAYRYQSDASYIKQRKHFAWLRISKKS